METSRAVIEAFDRLPTKDQAEVIGELLRRVHESGPLTDDGLNDVADQLFQMMDEEEAACAPGL